MYPKLLETLIEDLSKLPGIGRRSAERIAYWVLNNPSEEAYSLAQNIVNLKNELRFCRQCNNLSDNELCRICSDDRREKKMICVVEDPKDVISIERSGSYKGSYHVLLGAISPGEGRGPDDIKIQQLLNRVQLERIEEVILATDPDNDGEMTALYLVKVLKPLHVKISRIGMGLPMGSTVEFADMSTLGVALNARREITD